MMKALSVVSIALFVTVLEANNITNKVDNFTINCARVNELCSKDEDCCNSNSCRRSFSVFQKYCKTPVHVALKHWFEPKFERGVCEYRKSMNLTDSYTMYKRFGVNAAHRKLPPMTKVEVTVGRRDNKILIAINDRPLDRDGIVLELSEQAAEELDINQEGMVGCEIYVPVLDNYPNLAEVLYYLPCVGVVLMILAHRFSIYF